MIPAKGDAEEGEVKVNLFKKKNSGGAMVGKAGTFMFATKVHIKYANSHRIYFQIAPAIYCLGFKKNKNSLFCR